MKLYHGSYKKITKFDNAPIWLSDSKETANNYILAQSNGEAGSFGYLYEVEVSDSEIVTVEDFVSVDCGSILNEMEGNIFSATNDGEDTIFVIRNSSNYNFVECE